MDDLHSGRAAYAGIHGRGAIAHAGGGTGTLQPVPAHEPCGQAFHVPPSHHGCALAGWPLCDAISLDALPEAVSVARAHVRQMLLEWRRADLCDDAALVVSELVSNAVAASKGIPQVAPLGLWLGSDMVRVLLMVGDASSQPPLLRSAGIYAERGRGLSLVVPASCHAWGWHLATTAGLVKVVWALWQPHGGPQTAAHDYGCLWEPPPSSSDSPESRAH